MSENDYKVYWLEDKNATEAEKEEFGEMLEDYCSILVIKDGDREAYYPDCGDPEDRTFDRDFSWITSELIAAFRAGERKAKKDQSK